MIIKMRTTLMIHDKLFREAKIKAADRGITLSDLVEEGLRMALTSAASMARSNYRMMTFGEVEPQRHVSPEAMAETTDDEARGC
jgi:hypothetical protein